MLAMRGKKPKPPEPKKKRKKVWFNSCYTRMIAGVIAILENLHTENVYPQMVNTKIPIFIYRGINEKLNINKQHWQLL